MATKSSPSLLQRFTGRNGQQKLIEALQKQKLVGGCKKIASKIATHAERQELPTEHKLTTEGGADNDIYFILCGSVSIKINGRQVAIREAGDHIGEMALIDTTALRSATVYTLCPTVVVKMTELQFTMIADRHPILWRNMAIEIAKRLRERSKFHPAPRSEPVVFIGSSAEGLDISNRIARYLNKFPFVVKPWSSGVFECSKTTIEDLMSAAKQSDFAILILTGDDITNSRGTSKPAPRDNVIFEMGLFMGSISRERTFIIAQKTHDLKIPSDLLGVTYLSFQKRRGQKLSDALRPSLHKLRDAIVKLGPI